MGSWFTWLTSSGSLIVSLGGVAINSLWLPFVPSGGINIAVNGTTLYVTSQSQPQIIPLPVGTTSVTLSAVPGYTIYVFASSTAFDPINGVGSPIYASQIVPVTTAEATFGGMLTYVFNNGIALGSIVGSLITNATNNDIYLESSIGTTPGTLRWFGNGGANPATFLVDNTGNVTASGAIKALGGYVPPVFNANGTILASTTHIVIGQVTAGGVTTTINFVGEAQFPAINYAAFVVDSTASSVVGAGTYTSNSFTFNSTAGHIYTYLFIGA